MKTLTKSTSERSITQEFDNWFLKTKTSDDPVQLRVYLFPPAGSDVSIYSRWEYNLPSSIEVCKLKLPGRGMRISDDLMSDCHEIADIVAELIDSCTDVPFVIFGHSMGALITYETAVRLTERNNKLLKQIFVSAMKSPDTVSDEGCFNEENDNSALMMHKLNDHDLIEKLKIIGNIPDEIAQNEDYLDIIIPIFRNDLYLCDTYHLDNMEILDIPINVYGGTFDSVADAEQLEKWKAFSSEKVRITLFSGDHFYFEKNKLSFMFDFSRCLEAIKEK